MKLKLFKQKLIFVYMLILVFSVSMVNAQTSQQVSGTVVSASDNVPLPGASVMVKGTNNGTSTDFDGKFNLNVSNSNAILVISYIGYVPQEVRALGGEIIIALQEDSSSLDEIVVVGYGTQRKT